MLRASAAETGEELDLRGVGDASIDVGLPHQRLLGALAEAAVLRDADEMATARARALAELGPAATVRALAVVGNFEMMNRLLDAVGVGPPPGIRSIGAEIGVPLPARFLGAL